jgi:hypothetical protein
MQDTAAARSGVSTVVSSLKHISFKKKNSKWLKKGFTSEAVQQQNRIDEKFT